MVIIIKVVDYVTCNVKVFKEHLQVIVSSMDLTLMEMTKLQRQRSYIEAHQKITNHLP
jgi:hypothetical protein